MLVRFVIVFIFSILTIQTIALFRKKMPKKYFSLRQIIDTSKNDINGKGMLVICLPPFLYSMILSLIINQYKFEFVIIYGILTPVLIVWPTILSSKELLPPHIYSKRKSLYFIYSVYIFMYVFFSISGYNTYTFISSRHMSDFLNLVKFIDYYEKLPSFYQDMISGLIWYIVPLVLSVVYGRKIKNFYETKNKQKSL